MTTKAKRKKNAPVSFEALAEQKMAALNAAKDRRWKAIREAAAADRAAREAERQLARVALTASRGGPHHLENWLLHWWLNGDASPREARGLPCVEDVTAIPADAEPLPEPEGG